MDSYQKIQRTFSQTLSMRASAKAPAASQAAGPETYRPVETAETAKTNTPAASPSYQPDYEVPDGQAPVYVDTAGYSAPSSEYEAAYDIQRTSFEIRALKGDISFLPGFAITYVTQHPEIHFEYLGDFNYVPPREDTVGGSLNLYI